jgi:hypothetical protein
MRRPAFIAALVLPFAVAALPLASLLFWPSHASPAEGLAYTTATMPEATSPPADPNQASYGYNVDDPVDCHRYDVTVEG